MVIIRALPLACRGLQELVLENMALRQHLRAFNRTTKHPRLRTCDRLFWIVLGQQVATVAQGVIDRPAGRSCGGIAIGSAVEGPATSSFSTLTLMAFF